MPSPADDLLAVVMSLVAGISIPDYAVITAQNAQPVFKRSVLGSGKLRITGIIAGDRKQRIGRRQCVWKVGITLYALALGLPESDAQSYHHALDLIREEILQYRHTPVPGTVWKLVSPGRTDDDGYHMINVLSDPRVEIEAGVLATKVNLLFRAIQNA